MLLWSIGIHHDTLSYYADLHSRSTRQQPRSRFAATLLEAFKVYTPYYGHYQLIQSGTDCSLSFLSAYRMAVRPDTEHYLWPDSVESSALMPRSCANRNENPIEFYLCKVRSKLGMPETAAKSFSREAARSVCLRGCHLFTSRH